VTFLKYRGSAKKQKKMRGIGKERYSSKILLKRIY
jgi:hypothetical protein